MSDLKIILSAYRFTTYGARGLQHGMYAPQFRETFASANDIYQRIDQAGLNTRLEDIRINAFGDITMDWGMISGLRVRVKIVGRPLPSRFYSYTLIDTSRPVGERIGDERFALFDSPLPGPLVEFMTEMKNRSIRVDIIVSDQ